MKHNNYTAASNELAEKVKRQTTCENGAVFVIQGGAVPRACRTDFDGLDRTCQCLYGNAEVRTILIMS